MSARNAITRAFAGAAALLGAASCSDLPPFPAEPLQPSFSTGTCTPGTPCNLALNPSRSGFPSPLQSDPGWGGGSDTWDVVDGHTYYPWWAEGLALNYGGQRQVTIDFGAPQTFGEVVVWHHTDCCATGNNIPASVSLEYYDGAWHPIASFSRAYDLGYAPPPGMFGAYPDRYTFAAVTGSKVRWSYNGSGPNVLGTSGGWHGWVYEMEVFGAQQPPAREHEVSLTTFIPGNSIELPGGWMRYLTVALLPCRRQGGLYFGGDTRGFSPNAASFRTRQTVTVVPDAAADADGVKDGTSPVSRTGITRLYAGDALPVLDAADDDGVLYDCSLLHGVGQASTGGMFIVPTRTGPTSMRVRFYGGAANPLVPLAPAIDWDLTLDLDASGGTTHYQLTGWEDGFPAFEMYVDGHPVYTRNAPPPHRAQELLWLSDHVRNETVNTSGTLP